VLCLNDRHLGSQTVNFDNAMQRERQGSFKEAVMREDMGERKESLADVQTQKSGPAAIQSNGLLLFAEKHARDNARQLTEQQILDSLKAQGIGDLGALARATVKHFDTIGGQNALEPWEVFCGNSYVYRRGPIPQLAGDKLQQVNRAITEVERLTTVGR
jgi:hypothetical protein